MSVCRCWDISQDKQTFWPAGDRQTDDATPQAKVKHTVNSHPGDSLSTSKCRQLIKIVRKRLCIYQVLNFLFFRWIFKRFMSNIFWGFKFLFIPAWNFPSRISSSSLCFSCFHFSAFFLCSCIRLCMAFGFHVRSLLKVSVLRLLLPWVNISLEMEWGSWIIAQVTSLCTICYVTEVNCF